MRQPVLGWGRSASLTHTLPPSAGALLSQEAAAVKCSFEFVSGDYRGLLREPGFLLHAACAYPFILSSGPSSSSRAGRVPGKFPQDADLRS